VTTNSGNLLLDDGEGLRTLLKLMKMLKEGGERGRRSV